MNTRCRLEMAQFFGLDKVAKLRTIIKVDRPQYLECTNQ